MKSNLSEHLMPVDFAKLERDEINEILEWLDSDTDYYMRFLMWKHVKDNIEVLPEEETN